jgi:hypothetical protein
MKLSTIKQKVLIVVLLITAVDSIAMEKKEGREAKQSDRRERQVRRSASWPNRRDETFKEMQQQFENQRKINLDVQKQLQEQKEMYTKIEEAIKDLRMQNSQTRQIFLALKHHEPSEEKSFKSFVSEAIQLRQSDQNQSCSNPDLSELGEQDDLFNGTEGYNSRTVKIRIVGSPKDKGPDAADLNSLQAKKIHKKEKKKQRGQDQTYSYGTPTTSLREEMIPLIKNQHDEYRDSVAILQRTLGIKQKE